MEQRLKVNLNILFIYFIFFEVKILFFFYFIFLLEMVMEKWFGQTVILYKENGKMIKCKIK
jgi:hypothetical protein